MNRITARDVYLKFLIVFALAFAVGASTRGINMITRDREIEDFERDRNLIRVIEGRQPSNNEGLDRMIASMRTVLAADPRLDAGEVLTKAERLRTTPLQEIRSVDDAHWHAWVEIAMSEHRETFATLNGRRPLTELLRGTRTISESLHAPPPLGFWAPWTLWLVMYLVACLAFVVWYGIWALDGRFHPVRNAPWNRVPTLVCVLAAAPATFPCILAHGIWRLFVAEIPWTERWDRFSGRLAAALYRLRILRRLPPPVLAPLRIAPAETAAAHGIPSDAMLAAAPDVRPTEAGRDADDPDAPEWYVVRLEDFLGREHLLAAAGIEVYPLAVRMPEEIHGYAVQAKDIGSFERVLDLRDADPEDDDTDIARTVLRTYDGVEGDITVNGVPDDLVPMVTTALAAVSLNAESADIVFRHGHGEQVPAGAVEDDTIVVHHFASPHAGAKTALATVFGHEHPHGFKAIMPSPSRGRLVLDGDHAVAQVVGRNVYVFVDLLVAPQPWTQRLLARVLHEAAAKIGDAAENDEENAELWRGSLGDHREAYVRLCLKRLEDRAKEYEREIASCAEGIRDAGKTIAKLTRQRVTAERALADLKGTQMDSERDRLRKEFEQIVAAPSVVAVRATDDGIEVDTRTVFIEHMGRKFEIGRFRITFEGYSVFMRNLSNTNRRSHHEHPHVNGGGAACLGNMTEAVHKLIGEREYALAVNLLFQYLRSYNPPGRHAPIENWKEVTP